MEKVFVYGTLKQGCCRQHVLSGQKFLGQAKTTACYRMFDLGSYPAMVSTGTESGGNSIAGELYEVDDSCLVTLDVIECVADDLYRREAVKLLAPWDKENATTYIYLRSTEGHAEITNWPS